jgi:hypothetical protein
MTLIGLGLIVIDGRALARIRGRAQVVRPAAEP